MGIDQKLLNELIKTFQTELDEQSQMITNSLIKLEKGISSDEERKLIMENIFRAAHNLKGAARGLGINNVGEIAHRLESLFSEIVDNSSQLNSQQIDLCLNAVDKMRLALTAFVKNTPLEFDINALLAKLDKGDFSKEKPVETVKEPKKKIVEKTIATQIEEKNAIESKISSESVRIQIDIIDKLTSIMEEIQVSKISMGDHLTELNRITNNVNQFMNIWKQFYIESQHKHNIELVDKTKVFNAMNDHIIEVTHEISRIRHSFHAKTNSLTTQSNQLQEELGMLRLVPASTLLFTFPRYVRDLANGLKKNVELEVKGEDVKIDKLVLEGLKDPINHLLRNAIDHGIEEPAIREANKKSKVGHIKIDIKDVGSQVFITIHDDGAGIDTAKVAEIAEHNNIVSKEELAHMSAHEINELIFRPGFSTKDTITSISGRGVGLDVVKSNMSALKGTVNVSTIPGKGTTFTLCVPLTLSSERGLLVRCSDSLFVLPTSFIQRVLMLKPSDLVDISGGQAILIEGRPVPFRLLTDVLAIESDKEELPNDFLSTVVLSNGSHMVALLVDRIVGEREIVIKPLQAPLSNIRYVEGATLLDHNQLAVVLHMDDLIKYSLNISSTARIVPQEEVEAKKEKVHILVVDDSITTRTLEKNVLENKNYIVTTAVNGQEAWDLLQKQHFSLVITDVSMPVMDGFTLTERLKNSDKFRDLPVIIVTSLGSDAEKARGMEAGANAYVVKSEFESGALLEIVAQLV